MILGTGIEFQTFEMTRREFRENNSCAVSHFLHDIFDGLLNLFFIIITFFTDYEEMQMFCGDFIIFLPLNYPTDICLFGRNCSEFKIHKDATKCSVVWKNAFLR